MHPCFEIFEKKRLSIVAASLLFHILRQMSNGWDFWIWKITPTETVDSQMHSFISECIQISIMTNITVSNLYAHFVGARCKTACALNGENNKWNENNKENQMEVRKKRENVIAEWITVSERILDFKNFCVCVRWLMNNSFAWCFFVFFHFSSKSNPFVQCNFNSNFGSYFTDYQLITATLLPERSEYWK